MVITFLGKGYQTEKEKRAIYTFDEELSKKFKLKKSKYTNMLPLLIDNFTDEKIIPVYTHEAKKTQIVVLEDEFNRSYKEIFDDQYLIKDTKDFSSIMKLLHKVINQDDDYIIDLTHSFRHLPILATIALISNHNLDSNKVKHIFFAKEKIPNTKDSIGEYEIIDLKNYIELADISYMLSTFNQNYTISGNIQFSNPLYQQLANELKKFSEHFLSNSLKTIIDGSMIDDIFASFDNLQKEDDILDLNSFIIKIRLHLRKIQGLKGMKKEYEKFYALSGIMDERGYQLNAITLLFEALGYYCLDSIYQNTNKTKEHINIFKNFIKEKRVPKNVYSDYTLTNQSRNIVKLQKRFIGDFLFNPETITWSKQRLKETKYQNIPRKKSWTIKDEIFDYLQNISKQELKKFQNYIIDMEALRNNLAHGNSSDEIKDIEKLFENYVKKYDYFVKDNDILNKIQR